VAEHPLYRLDARPGRHGETRSSVPQVGRREGRQAGLLDRRVEEAVPEVGIAERSAARSRALPLARTSTAPTWSAAGLASATTVQSSPLGAIARTEEEVTAALMDKLRSDGLEATL